MHLKNGIIFILIFPNFTLQETRRRTDMTLNSFYREQEQRTISVFCYHTSPTLISLKTVSLWKHEVSRKKFSDFPTRQFLVRVRHSVTVVRQVWKFGCEFNDCGARFRVIVHIISPPSHRCVLWAEFISYSSDDAFWTSELTYWTWLEL